MSKKGKAEINAERRTILAMLGFGAATTAVGTVGSKSVFAKQFLEEGAEMKIPQMVYDPNLQMMVDPITRRPIYDQNRDFKLAKVTAGCKDCPKYDEG
jgi:hypothetical protein